MAVKVLLIKTSSLGDVLHALPAVTDAHHAIPDIRFDWVVEEAFAEVPAWHPAVDRVIPVAIRRWRKSPLKALLSGEWSSFRRTLQAKRYDLVLDAQGLIKSALITKMAYGPRYGLDRCSAREPLASRFYDYPQDVPKGAHAIERLRQLFAQTLNYPLPESEANSGILPSPLPSLRGKVGMGVEKPEEKNILFIHGTTWPTKHWPDPYWVKLATIVNEAGYQILLPWANQEEHARAEQIAASHEATILQKGSLSELIEPFQQVSGMVCVDSGLAHLGAALKIPSVTLYGATNPGLTGTWGSNQQHLSATLECAPCLKRRCEQRTDSEIEPVCYVDLTPQRAWKILSESINSTT